MRRIPAAVALMAVFPCARSDRADLLIRRDDEDGSHREGHAGLLQVVLVEHAVEARDLAVRVGDDRLEEKREARKRGSGGTKGESEEDPTAVALAVSVQLLTRLQLRCCCPCFHSCVTDEVNGASDDLVDVLDPAAVVVHLVHGQSDHLR